MLRYLKPVLFLACLIPLGRLVWRGFHAELGANPIEAITHGTGDWTLTFLLLTLSVSPLRKLTRQYWLIGLRRMLGLFAFFYGTLHLMTWLWLDKFFDVHEMLADVVKRRFITAGMTAFALMIPLALTSTKWSIRKLGGKRWQTLHRLIYFSAMAGVIHYIWLVKADLRKPLEYAAVLGCCWSIDCWCGRVRRSKRAPQQAQKLGSRRAEFEDIRAKKGAAQKPRPVYL